MIPPLLDLEREGIRYCAEAAAGILAAGGIVCAPTDTLHGLLLRYSDREAVERLYRLKGRDAERRLLALVASPERVEGLSSIHLPVFARRLWPGPLTLVLPVSATTHPLGWDTQAFRVPASPWLATLLELVGEPLFAPSANPQGAPPAGSSREARDYFGDRVDLYIGKAAGESEGLPSTLVGWSEGSWHLLREGAIPATQLQDGLM